MSVQITLTVPDTLYQQAAQAALARQQPVEVLLTDILAGALTSVPSPQPDPLEREEQVWELLRPHLVANYLGEVVALHEGQIVDHDADELALVARIDARFPKEVVLLRRVTAQPLLPLRFRSPRFVRDT